jgi:hypothetical protein
MLKLDLLKLTQLTESLGEYIDGDSLFDEVPFIYFLACKSKNNNQRVLIYLIDLISMKVIFEPYNNVYECLTDIGRQHDFSGITYNYCLKTSNEFGNYTKKGTETIKLQKFIPRSFFPNVHTKEFPEQNPYDMYMWELINLLTIKLSLGTIGTNSYISTLGVESFLIQIKSLRKEINEKLKEKVDNYPFELIKD